MASEILKTGALETTLEKGAILAQAHRLKTTLVQCVKVARKFENDLGAEIAALDASGFKLASSGRALERFPVLHGLEEMVTTFLISARRAIREVCALVRLFVPTVREHSNLSHLIKDLEGRVSPDTMLWNVLRAHDSGAERICDLRNGQEHPKPGTQLHIENFRLMPTNQIRAPVFYLDDEEPQHIPAHLNAIAEFLTTLVEECLVAGIHLRLDQRLPWAIQIDPDPPKDKPVKYVVSLDVSRLNSPAKQQ